MNQNRGKKDTMPYLLPALGILTAIGVTAYLFAEIENDELHHEEDDKAIAVLVGLFAGLVFPLTWLVILVYSGGEITKKLFVENED